MSLCHTKWEEVKLTNVTDEFSKGRQNEARKKRQWQGKQCKHYTYCEGGALPERFSRN